MAGGPQRCEAKKAVSEQDVAVLCSFKPQGGALVTSTQPVCKSVNMLLLVALPQWRHSTARE